MIEGQRVAQQDPRTFLSRWLTPRISSKRLFIDTSWKEGPGRKVNDSIHRVLVLSWSLSSRPPASARVPRPRAVDPQVTPPVDPLQLVVFERTGRLGCFKTSPLIIFHVKRCMHPFLGSISVRLVFFGDPTDLFQALAWMLRMERVTHHAGPGRSSPQGEHHEDRCMDQVKDGVGVHARCPCTTSSGAKRWVLETERGDPFLVGGILFQLRWGFPLSWRQGK